METGTAVHLEMATTTQDMTIIITMAVPSTIKDQGKETAADNNPYLHLLIIILTGVEIEWEVMTKIIRAWVVASITVREKIAVAEEGVEAILQEVVGIMGLRRFQPTTSETVWWVDSILIRHPSTTTITTTTVTISQEYTIDVSTIKTSSSRIVRKVTQLGSIQTKTSTLSVWRLAAETECLTSSTRKWGRFSHSVFS